MSGRDEAREAAFEKRLGRPRATGTGEAAEPGLTATMLVMPTPRRPGTWPGWRCWRIINHIHPTAASTVHVDSGSPCLHHSQRPVVGSIMLLEFSGRITVSTNENETVRFLNPPEPYPFSPDRSSPPERWLELSLQEYVDGPHGWIQWKGTDVCIDLRCACGELHHFDGYFAYKLLMPCGRLYVLGTQIPLFLLKNPTREDLSGAIKIEEDEEDDAN